MNLEITLPRNDIPDRLEIAMLSLPPEAGVKFAEDFPVEHHFAPGIYVRCLHRPKGTWIIGHAHRHADQAQLLYGRLRIYADGKFTELVGPSTPFRTDAGVRKFTVAMEDSCLATYHFTSERDIEKLEEEIFIKSPAFLEYETERRLTEPNWNKPKETLICQA